MTDLISDEYLDQLVKMRSDVNPRWGNGGMRNGERVTALAKQHKIKTLLDYGCGHGKLLQFLKSTLPTVTLAGYDPGMPQYAASPEPADMVISTDVLEHIEPDKLAGVLTHIRFLTRKVAYLVPNHALAKAILPNGTNAHLIVESREWWHAKLQEYFQKVEAIPDSSPQRTIYVCE